MDFKQKKVILWSPPRCLSNVFCRSIETLKKTKCIRNLFSGPYYFGPNHPCHIYAPLLDSQLDLEGLSVKDLTYEQMKALVTADYPDVDLVFIKDHPHCLPESLYQDLISGAFASFIHTFLIRDPERALYSNYKASLSQQLIGSNLDPPSGGFNEMYKFYNFIKEKQGTTPVIVDAADLQTHPDETMRSFCKAVGICFDSNMMSWEPAPFHGHYNVWKADWHQQVSQSTGFIKTKPGEQKPVPLYEMPSDVVKCIEDSRVYYTEMRKDCIKPLF
ncbi:uncharacterized protein [Dysidea avara]|uniref:uncharacterized protein isoform X1 n=1 Tax=Dysidea avara TaxID=196820 RepID=UPI003328047C